MTAALAHWVQAVTGTPVEPGDFRLPRTEGQLSLGAFVTGDARAAARRLQEARAACPQVRDVREKNGWLLFFLSDSWFNGLIAWAKELDTRPTGSYLENRMAMLARKGDSPCPDAEPVRRALWAAFLAYRRGFWRAADERLCLTMTHAPSDEARLAWEGRCGGAAAAIAKLRGDV